VTDGVGALVRGAAGCEDRPERTPVREDGPEQAVADRARDPAPGVTVSAGASWEAEHPLRDDVALNLRRAAGDGLREGVEVVVAEAV